MIQFKYSFILFIFFILSCSTMKVNLVDSIGRVVPNPHYILKAIEAPITATFYYTAYKKDKKDLDGSFIAAPVFLDFLEYHKLFFNSYKSITLTVEINNPKNIEYTISQQIIMKTKGNDSDIQVGGIVKRSNLLYRQFIYTLPYREDIKEVDNLLTLNIGENEVMRIGNFRYKLIH